MAVREIKLVGKYILEAKLEALTGLHIGTSKDTMKIGDVDNPVIRDVNGIPYIQGKMRALMELFHGKLKPDAMVYAKYPDIRLRMCDEKDCQVCGLFGRNHGSHSFVLGNEKKDFENICPTRLIVKMQSSYEIVSRKKCLKIWEEIIQKSSLKIIWTE